MATSHQIQELINPDTLVRRLDNKTDLVNGAKEISETTAVRNASQQYI